MEIEPLSVQLLGALINVTIMGGLIWGIYWLLKQSEYR